MFQHFHLLDDLTVYENLDIPLSYRDVPRKEREARVAEILDRFQMVGKKDLYPPQLSGGQQQQVAVARAVIARPRSRARRRAHGQSALEPRRGDHAALRKLNESGTTIIQVSHDERVAASAVASSSSRTAGSAPTVSSDGDPVNVRCASIPL